MNTLIFVTVANFILKAKRHCRLLAITLCFVTIPAHALLVTAQPGSDHRDAQVINGKFDLAFSADIGDVTGTNTSTSIPHATIDASGAGYGRFHWYSFDVAKSSTVILDVDYGAEYVVTDGPYPSGITDTLMHLYGDNLHVIATNDDHTPENGPVAGAGGSIFHYDSFIQTMLDPGLYYVAISQYLDVDFTAENGYLLQISVSHPVPEPSSKILILLAFGAFFFKRYRIN